MCIRDSIKIACAVIILLYSWLSAMYCTPGPANSNLISTEKAVPTNPENNAKIRYNVPISLALQDKNHLSVHIEIFLMKYSLQTPISNKKTNFKVSGSY